MVKALKRAISFFFFLFKPPIDKASESAPGAGALDLQVSPESPPSVVEQPQPKVRPPRTKLPAAVSFKEDLLEDLDRMFFFLKSMKKGDPNAYMLHRRFGTYLPCRDTMLDAQLNPWWKYNRPAFGCMFFPVDHSDYDNLKSEMINPRFLYFRKYDAKRYPKEVQPPKAGWDVYILSVYWDVKTPMRKVPRARYVTETPIAISQNGDLVALRTLNTGKTPTARWHGRDGIPTKNWKYSRWFEVWAAEKQKKPSDFLVTLFVTCANLYVSSHFNMVQVRVKKGSVQTSFGIEGTASAAFFRDREPVMHDGRSKPIFHSVRPHSRTSKSGASSSAVRMHFRGLRQFTWNGYEIDITVPGRDHFADFDFDVGAVDDADEKNEMVKDNEQLADWLEDYRRKGVGAYAASQRRT